MPAISNLEKARKKINEEASKVQAGGYTLEVASKILTSAAKEFNLGDDKVAELKAFKFERQLDGQKEEVKELTPEQRIEHLESALSKIATLTGYGNQLKEFGITMWSPGKKDMSKNRG